MAKGEKPTDRMGAMWEKEDKYERTYMSGEIDVDGKTIGVVMFRNFRKERDGSPDWYILKRRPKRAEEKPPEEERLHDGAEMFDDDELPF